MSFASQDGPDVLIAIKAVPGASRDEIVGPLGDRLKVRVRQPPEGGRANQAILALIAGALGVPESRVALQAGATRATKTVRVMNATASEVATKLSAAR